MIILDFLLLLMIGICITYCWVLNRRIQDLQNSRIEFARMIKELNVSIVKAQTSVAELSDLSKVTSEELKTHIDEAKVVINNLSTINNVSNNLASTLSSQIDNIVHNRKNNAHSSLARDARFGDDDLIDDELDKPQQQTSYTNHLKNFVTQIVSKKPETNASLNQMNYYDTLKRISVKK